MSELRFGIFDNTAAVGAPLDVLLASAAGVEADGFAHYWLPQIFAWEALSVLAVVGREVPRIELGTAVVPTYPRHPVTLAAEALTAQSASGGRLTLGIGLSHQMVIENMFGLDFSKPVRHMSEYLDVLLPLLNLESASAHGETISANMTLGVPGSSPVPVVVAALGSKMLAVAGARTAGTVTWMTGPATIKEHISPSIRSAAKAAGRTEPRVICALPVCVTDDPAAARARAATVFSIYGHLPSYRAMLDREGAAGPADVAIVGDESTVRGQIEAIGEAGATDFVAVEFTIDEPERTRTRDLLRSLL